MASHTRPFLTSGAALASAAAVVLATPAIAPTITASPLSVSSARYDLTTFADVFTIPLGEWVNAYFQGYGGIVGPNNPFPLEPYASNCDGTCFLVGPSSLAYLALDALINGNGNGWDDNTNWDVSAINYLFEADWSFDPGGISAGVLYLLQTSIGSANPIISTAITLAFAGPALVTIVFDNALQLLGDAALGLPLVGSYVYGAINAFLGPASLNPDFQAYFPGVSGVLNYALDVLSGTAPTPPEPEADPAPESGAAVAAAALTAVAAEPEAAEEASGNAAVETPAVEAAEVQASVADSPSVTAADAQADTQEAVTASDAESVTASDTESDTGAAAESAPATAAEVKAETADAAEAAPAAQDRPAKAASKRPVRDAVAKVTSSIASSIGSALGAPAADSADAGAADSGSTADSDS